MEERSNHKETIRRKTKSYVPLSFNKILPSFEDFQREIFTLKNKYFDIVVEILSFITEEEKVTRIFVLLDK